MNLSWRFLMLFSLPLIALSSILRKEMNKAQIMSVVGGYPAHPTFATGVFYTDSGCTNSGGGLAVLLDTCLATSSFSIKFTCAGNTVSIHNYTDTTCTTPVTSPSSTFSVCSDFKAPVGGGYSINAYTTVTSCSSTNNSIPSALVNVFMGEYADSVCSQSVATIGLINDACYEISGAGSAKLLWPQGNFYMSTDCSGSVAGSGSMKYSCQAEGDTTNAITNGFYTLSTTTTNFASKNVHLGMGVFLSLLMVVVQLF